MPYGVKLVIFEQPVPGGVPAVFFEGSGASNARRRAKRQGKLCYIHVSNLGGLFPLCRPLLAISSVKLWKLAGRQMRRHGVGLSPHLWWSRVSL